jgi:periplasmic protein TonB
MKAIKVYFVVAFILTAFTLQAQSNDSLSEKCLAKYDTLLNREFYTFTDTLPEFPGGMQALMKYLVENIEYPNDEVDFQGSVYVSFIVESDGQITNCRLLKGIYSRIDAICLEVISKMPQWTPGKCNGKNVPVEFRLPIRFKLE